jgi:Hsp70 protein
LRVSGIQGRYGEDRPIASDTTDTGVRRMSSSLGLSVGVANLVAARAGSPPVARRSVLTIYDQRPSEVGMPDETPSLTEPGLLMRGFIERVGDRAPLVAPDGTKYDGAALTVEALEAMARTVGHGTPITIAVPAHWSESQIAALREEFFAQPGLAPGGVPPVLISDATAAMAALRTRPGFPTAGVVALCDFGASGTSVSLINVGANSQQIGPPLRYVEFSGDAIDQLILNHLHGTAPFLDECRRAKEQLSTATVTTIAPGATGSVDAIQLSRTEFEQLISAPLDQFVDTLEDALQRNSIPRSALATVAIVGGGASIPLIAAHLSGRLHVPIATAADGKCCAAVGAAAFGQQRSSAAVLTTASPMIENPTEMVESGANALAGDDGLPLAWSEDADEDDPVPYTGPEHTGGYGRDTTGFDDADGDLYATEPERLPWYKRTALILILAGAVAAILAAVVLALTLGRDKPNPIQPAPPPPPETVTVTAPPPSETTPPPVTTTTAEPPPPETTTNPAPPPPITTTEPPTTTAAPPPPPPPRERPWPPRRLDPWRR